MGIIVVFILQISIKSNRRLLVQTLLDNILQIREGASADKQDIPCCLLYTSDAADDNVRV